VDTVYVETAHVRNKQADVPRSGVDRALVLRVREIACRAVRKCWTPIGAALKQRIYSLNLFNQPLFSLFLTEQTESNIDRYAAVFGAPHVHYWQMSLRQHRIRARTGSRPARDSGANMRLFVLRQARWRLDIESKI